MDFYPVYDEFRVLAKDYNTIPIFTEIAADLETPISLYLKLVGDEPGFMLESAESGRNFGRYSFIGFKPIAEFIGKSEHSEVVYGGGGRKIFTGKPMDVLRRFLTEFSTPDSPNQPPFLGGGVGYFAYDLAATLERLRGYECPKDAELVRLLFCRLILVLDHLTHKLKIIYLARPEGDDYRICYNEALRQLSDAIAKIAAPAIMPDDRPYHRSAECFTSPDADSLAAHHYMAAVDKAKEYIAAGDAFQIVLSTPFAVELPRHPFNLYRQLRGANPSPYMFYLNFGQKRLVGASPEMLVKVEDGRVYTCPIAGTRPRGVTPQEDELLAAELLADVKERAEHSMLVDLGRNDVGRISAPGTVTVERFMEVEKFSHVMHLVSLVTGQLRSEYTALDALGACFPAGTVSGAPKVRAMEIIHELEGGQRGAYAGAVGYLDFRGNMDTCITIRTLFVEGTTATVRTGAGIVYDSDAAKEYQEVLHKGRALFKLMED